jgi:hypothetical protein
MLNVTVNEDGHFFCSGVLSLYTKLKPVDHLIESWKVAGYAYIYFE